MLTRFTQLLQSILATQDNKVDKVTGKQLSTEDYSTLEKQKLSGIASGANNYDHPITHPVAIIDGQSYPLQFVKTDSNGNTGWGYVVWGEITGKPATFTPSAHSHNEYILATQIGAANGLCPLGADNLINPSFIGALNMSDVFEVADEASMLALSSAGKADFAIRNDLNNAVFMLKALPSSTLANWVSMNFNANVASVNGKTGVVVLTKNDIGLGNVDNTSDANKPISNATQEALDTKQPIDATLTAIAALVVSANKMIYATGNDTFDVADLTAFARTLLGNTDAATMRTTLEVLSSTEVTTAISTAVSNIVASSPAALDTLNELAAALGNDANFATTVMNALSGKQATLNSGTNIKTINNTSLLGSGNITVSSDASGVRQTIQSGSIDDLTGLPNFCTAGSAFSVNVDATVPIKIHAAGGDANRLVTLINNMTISGLAANALNYCYFDVASDGTITGGSTTNAPIYTEDRAPATVDVIPTMTSNTAPSGIASASTIYNASYDAWYAFNKSTADKWETQSGVVTGWLKYQFPTAKTILSYALTLAGSAGAYSPKNWTFEGSNDNTNWTVLDTQTNQTQLATDGTYTYNFANTTAYLYYRINITANNGSVNGTVINELYMYESVSKVNGQFYFNTSAMKAYVGDGSAPQQAFRVFFAQAQTNGVGVTSVVNYALNGYYDSGWTNTLPSGGSATIKNHNIGTDMVKSNFSIKNITTDLNYPVGTILSDLVTRDASNVPAAISVQKTRLTSRVALGSGNPIVLLNYTTFSASSPTAASWAYKITAQREF